MPFLLQIPSKALANHIITHELTALSRSQSKNNHITNGLTKTLGIRIFAF